jgi:hypothetical protein
MGACIGVRLLFRIKALRQCFYFLVLFAAGAVAEEVATVMLWLQRWQSSFVGRYRFTTNPSAR